MSLLWFFIDYNFYMIAFALKYFPGNIYINGYASSLSDVAAYIFSSYIYTKLGTVRTFVTFSVLTTIASYLMILCWTVDS